MASTFPILRGMIGRESGQTLSVTVALLTRTPKCFDQTAIRRDVITLLQDDNVTRHELVREQPSDHGHDSVTNTNLRHALARINSAQTFH
jgi:hypothetical protein